MSEFEVNDNSWTIRHPSFVRGEIKVGPYALSPHPPIPGPGGKGTEQQNVVWIEHEEGEGMTVDLDKIWEGF